MQFEDYAAIYIRGAADYLARFQLGDGQTIATGFKTLAEARAYLRGLGYINPRIILV